MNENKELQVFNVKLNEKDINQLVSLLMTFTAGEVYNLIRKMEVQTSEQRKLPEDKKVYEPDPDIPYIKQKKEGT
jgi:hypothetical protein